VAERADGLAVREDDAEPEPLDDESMLLGDGEIVAMAVKESPPLLWRRFHAARVALSEDGAVATPTIGGYDSLTTTEIELTEGKHYWEVELLSRTVVNIPIGISRPNLDPKGDYATNGSTDGWFIHADDGGLYGNGKEGDDGAGGYHQGDRVGALLDLDNGSLRFFKNGERRREWAWLPSGKRDWTRGGSSADVGQRSRCEATNECRSTCGCIGR
jgi:hypothetical protein